MTRYRFRLEGGVPVEARDTLGMDELRASLRDRSGRPL
jgi:hypothetical protein